MGPKKEGKTCFVSSNRLISSSNSITDYLSKILFSHDYDVIYPAIIEPHLGKTIFSMIRERIDKCDVFIAVLFNRCTPNQLIELGYAYGRNKPVLIIATDDVDLPSDLKDFQHIRITPGNFSSLDFAIPSFLYALEKRTIPTRRSESRKILIEDNLNISDKVVEPVRSLSNAKYCEEFVGELFKSHGYIIEKWVRRKDEHHAGYEFDFVVWLDKLDNVIKNPVPIEIKWHPSRAILKHTELQFKQMVEMINGDLGLIVYFSDDEVIPPIGDAKTPLIIRYSSRELQNKLNSGTFEKSILDHISQIRYGEGG